MMVRLFFVTSLLLCQFAHAQGNPSPSAGTLDAAAKKILIDSLSVRLSGYVFPEKIPAIRQAVAAFQKNKALMAISSPAAWGDSLNICFMKASQDKHLKIFYAPDTTSHGDVIGRLARIHDNGFDKVEIFPGNIGYMRIIGFFPSPRTTESIRSAFEMVAGTDALIIDLRSNQGGEMQAALLSVSYFFKDPVDLFDMHFPGQQKIEQHWSSSYVPGTRYLDKPVYVLTGGGTFSGGEAFAYVLQAQKRATIIGEPTAGGANITEMARLPGGFLFSLPVGSPIEPVTKANWESVGVKPDRVTTSEQSLLTAYRAALQSLESTATDSTDRQDIGRLLQSLPHQ